MERDDCLTVDAVFMYDAGRSGRFAWRLVAVDGTIVAGSPRTFVTLAQAKADAARLPALAFDACEVDRQRGERPN